jgi:hypothetical protein
MCLAKLGHFSMILYTLIAEIVELMGLKQDSSQSSGALPARISSIVYSLARLSFLDQLSSSKSSFEPFWLSLARAKIVGSTILGPNHTCHDSAAI